MPREETPHERFVRIGEKRTKRALKEIELLKNLANRSHYSFTEEEVNRIFGALENQLREARAQFVISRSRGFRLR